jgi:hypothetical protein
MIKLSRDHGAAAQGDCLLVPVAEIPSAATPSDSLVVAHSETGHHHVIDAAEHEARLFTTANPMICYLQITGEFADLVHQRPWDTHETLRLPGGCYQVRRQREGAPEGWRRVAD